MYHSDHAVVKMSDHSLPVRRVDRSQRIEELLDPANA